LYFFDSFEFPSIGKEVDSNPYTSKNKFRQKVFPDLGKEANQIINVKFQIQIYCNTSMETIVTISEI